MEKCGSVVLSLHMALTIHWPPGAPQGRELGALGRVVPRPEGTALREVYAKPHQPEAGAHAKFRIQCSYEWHRFQMSMAMIIAVVNIYWFFFNFLHSISLLISEESTHMSILMGHSSPQLPLPPAVRTQARFHQWIRWSLLALWICWVWCKSLVMPGFTCTISAVPVSGHFLWLCPAVGWH